MTDELRKAAERYRKHLAMVASVRNSPIEGGHGLIVIPAAVSEARDLLAQAYLAEHPADDDEPIDEEWLRGMGFENGTWCHRSQLMLDTRVDDLRVNIDGTNVCLAHRTDESGNFFDGVATRGQLRSLLKALGIEVKP